MKKFLKNSILNVVGKDIVIHIVLPICLIILGILLYITNCYTNIYAIGMFTTMVVSLIVIGWYNYTSYPKDHRIALHCEYIPWFGIGVICDKHVGFGLPFCMVSINFNHLYKYKQRLL